MSFSSALKLTDLDDFITPSQACVKPEIIQKSDSRKKAKIRIEDDGTYLEVTDQGTTQLESAKISLNDCLACSGCITTAESILITAQSTKEFLSNVEDPEKRDFLKVVSISPQSRASIAAHFRITSLSAHRRLISLFKSLGVHHVFDTSFSRVFSLLESAAEFVARYRKQASSPLPMFASACPGWVCYAEKQYGDLLVPHISTTKSPQQVMGTLVKYYFAPKVNISPDHVYHTTVMPCYDKKLEASRDDFYNETLRTHDVDCVLSSGEILELLHAKNIDFLQLPEADIEPLFTNVSAQGQLLGTAGGGSGGYLEFIFRYAAKELFGVDVKEIEYQAVRGQTDMRTATLTVEGKPVLCFAAAYGFKHINNVVRKLKQQKNVENFSYHFIEIMACPGGCTNGGGQIRPEKGEAPRDLLARVNIIYDEALPQPPQHNIRASEIYQQWLGGVFSADSLTKLHTQYHVREKIQLNPLAIKW